MFHSRFYVAYVTDLITRKNLRIGSVGFPDWNMCCIHCLWGGAIWVFCCLCAYASLQGLLQTQFPSLPYTWVRVFFSVPMRRICSLSKIYPVGFCIFIGQHFCCLSSGSDSKSKGGFMMIFVQDWDWLSSKLPNKSTCQLGKFLLLVGFCWVEPTFYSFLGFTFVNGEIK